MAPVAALQLGCSQPVFESGARTDTDVRAGEMRYRWWARNDFRRLMCLLASVRLAGGHLRSSRCRDVYVSSDDRFMITYGQVLSRGGDA